MSDEVTSSQLTEKAEVDPKATVRPLQTEKGQPRIMTSNKFVQEQRQQDLRMPQRLCTFDNMILDAAVANSIDVTNVLVLNALYNGKFVSPSGSQRGQVAADFLNYNIRNMTYGTWMDFITQSTTDLQYGFAFFNIVLERRNYGTYAGNLVLKKLSPRDQDSLYGFVWDKEFREFRGILQKPNRKQIKQPTVRELQSGNFNIATQNLTNGIYPFMDVQQLLHFRHNPKTNDPAGHSPLVNCYQAWKEKELIERYEVIGVSKDLGGAVVLRVPSELIERANDPANYPNEAQEYTNLQKDAANLHAGESSYIVLSSDVDEATKQKLFDFELKGIDGGGKQYKTSEIIDQKRKDIYNVFGTGFLLLGQNGHGSNALSSNQMTTHDYYVERNVMWKKDVLDTQLAPRLLAANNIFLDYKDMPVFIPADPSKPDLDVISKVIQRTKSVGGMTQEAMTHLYEQAGWPTDGIEDLIFDDGNTSRAGESGGTSGTGSTQQGGANSETNVENSVRKDLVIDYETEDQIVAVDTTTGSPVFINKEE